MGFVRRMQIIRRWGNRQDLADQLFLQTAAYSEVFIYKIGLQGTKFLARLQTQLHRSLALIAFVAQALEIPTLSVVSTDLARR